MELSGGAPGWPEEEGFPVWKTAVPGVLKDESFCTFTHPDFTVTSRRATCSKVAFSAWGQPEQGVDR